MPEENNRSAVIRYGFVAWLITIFMALVWEFTLEAPILGSLGYNSGDESVAEHLHFVIEAASSSAIGIGLTILLYRGLNKTVDGE